MLMRSDMQKMDANAQRMDAKMEENAQALKGDWQKQMDVNARAMERKMNEGRGEMQCLGLSL